MLRKVHKEAMLLTLCVGVGAGSMMAPKSAEAVPAFARQTGMACTSCHANNFPALNSFGRSFRASGYTMRGSADLVEGDDLSIPADLKASLITKIRYNLPGNVDGGRGEIQWPDEAALLIGGRAAENVGFLLEAGLAGQEGHADLTTGEVETGGNFLSYKSHFNVSDNFGLVVFGTDGLGVGYGMELMNTAQTRSQRPIENRRGMSAYQRLGTASGTATGIAAVYHTGNLMVNYSHWAPTWGNVNANIFGGLAHYLRANYFMNAAGWDMGVGAYTMTGDIDVGATDPAATVSVAGSGVDFQALGTLGAMPAEFYFSYGNAPSGDNEHFNAGADDHTAYALLGKFGVANNTSAYLAYGNTDFGDDGDSVSDTTVGVQYMVAQNIKLELYNVTSDSADDGDDYTQLMLFHGY